MIDMDETRSLIAFVGLHDPYPDKDDEESGPILALLLEMRRRGEAFDEAWLLCTGGDFLERARDLQREAAEEGLGTRVRPVDFPLKDVIDYAEIWEQLGRSLENVRASAGTMPRSWTFLLDSGTPQMKTSLFLAARSGLFPARLVQGIPPRFAGGAYKVREVRLDGIPEVRLAREGQLPGAAAASPGRTATEPHSTAGAAEQPKPVSTSHNFVLALRAADAAARYDEPVLLLGETGTGKTMIARRIHGASPRRDGPFVEVNCSAIVASMAESELFGHEKGAFTGADKARSGKLRAASGGTLFLDEIGDLSPDIQAKLLTAIEDKRVTPLGSDSPAAADARLVAATNRDLPAMIREGKFRRDLYERLKVVVINLPPLRERRGDVRPLAELFLAEWNEPYGERRFLTEDALLALESYSWPGNVRELRYAIRSAACTAASEAIGPESLPGDVRAASYKSGALAATAGALVDLPAEGLNLKARMLQIEWQYVSEALRRAGGNAEAAAKALGMTGHAFRKALKERFAGFVDGGGEEGI